MSYDSWKAREPEPPECTIHDWGDDEDIPDEELECKRCVACPIFYKGTQMEEFKQEFELVDINGPEEVEVRIRSDGKVVWVNIDGVCRLRACQIKQLVVQDDRNDHDMDC